MICRFPFSEGVHIDPTEYKQTEHADGTFTENSFIPFCFSKHQSLQFQELQNKYFFTTQLSNCLYFDGTMDEEGEKSILSRTFSLLERDGFAILTDRSRVSASCELHEYISNDRGHVVKCKESFPLLANPIIMSLCDGVIGHQILRVDQKQGLEGIVFPPSIFTDMREITTIPWELQAAEYNLESFISNKYIRSADHNTCGFKLRTKLDKVLEVVWAMNGSECDQFAMDKIRLIRGSHMWSELQDRSMGSSSDCERDDVFEWEGRPGEVLVFLSDTYHQYVSPVSSVRRFLWTSYHAAYLRQRCNMYTICPPAEAVTLPPFMQRLIGYSMPGPVLNKLYCGSGDAEILKAFRAYESRAIDWAGAACEQENADEYAKLCDANCIAAGAVEVNSLNLENIGEWIANLPHRNQGLVVINNSDPDAFPLLLSAMVRDGCAVIENAVSTSLCDAVMAQLQPYTEHVKGAAVGCIPARSSAAWPIASHPLVLQLCESILGKQSLRMTSRQLQASMLPPQETFPYQIHICLTIPKQAGGTAQSLHRDGDLSLIDMPSLAGVDHAISTIWALDGDFTEERGTTRVVLGSHDWPPSRQVSPCESIPAVMCRGSVLVYTGRTVHGAGHNTTESARIALNVGYNSSCLKQEENQYVSVPPGIIETLPKSMQKLLGYYS